MYPIGTLKVAWVESNVEYLSSVSNESGYYEAPTGGMFTDKEEYEKQLVRIADVFILGPFLIYVATIKSLPKHIRAILFLIGILTIIYNGKNYIKTIK